MLSTVPVMRIQEAKTALKWTIINYFNENILLNSKFQQENNLGANLGWEDPNPVHGSKSKFAPHSDRFETCI